MSHQITGMLGTSKKENEHRLPIHPEHLDRIPESLYPDLRFEQEYGSRFGLEEIDLGRYCGGLMTRPDLLASCDVVVAPKPLPEDLAAMRDGATLWGWPHCVQQEELTQIAIDKKLTLIAFEAMFYGSGGVHIFYKNNELAGYCSVLHALELLGIDGHYGRRRSAAVLGFGSVGRGAVFALQGRGFHDITVFTQRPSFLVRDQVLGCRYQRMRRSSRGGVKTRRDDGKRVPLADELAHADVVVNATLQDTDRPLQFVSDKDVAKLRPGCLVVDVSADLGMGFPFARPTSFAEPTFEVGEITYYGVDHSPSYLWDAATWAISEGVLPYLSAVMKGPEGWEEETVVADAIEIRDGVVRNPKILSFQNRDEAYPHRIRGR